jgi:uncharacterized membrane protein
MLPPDLDLPRAAAIIVIFAAWGLYGPVLTVFGKGTLNMQLHAVRRRWMRMLTLAPREKRTFDGIMMGHISNAMAFFGSATLLVLAGLVGTIANAAQVHHAVDALNFTGPMSTELFALYLGVLTAVMAIAFFSFIYALRKLSYVLAMIGGLGEAPEDGLPAVVMRNETATVMTEAVRSLNNGVRGYYYAIAALFLFIGPVASMVMTAVMTGILFYRQVLSPTARAIGRYVDAMEGETQS